MFRKVSPELSEAVPVVAGVTGPISTNPSDSKGSMWIKNVGGGYVHFRQISEIETSLAYRASSGTTKTTPWLCLKKEQNLGRETGNGVRVQGVGAIFKAVGSRALTRFVCTGSPSDVQGLYSLSSRRPRGRQTIFLPGTRLSFLLHLTSLSVEGPL